MKKLIFIFVILFVLVVITGCSARKNTVHFNPKVTTEGDEDNKSDEERTVSIEEDKGPDLAITSFDGEGLETTVGYHVIRGTTPKNTNTIKINDYTLSRYYSGQTEWSYIASATVGTLEEGKNEYTVYSLDSEGNEIGTQNFTITYEPPENLPSVGSSGWMALIISFLISIGYFAFGSEVFRRKLKIEV